MNGADWQQMDGKIAIKGATTTTTTDDADDIDNHEYDSDDDGEKHDSHFHFTESISSTRCEGNCRSVSVFLAVPATSWNASIASQISPSI